MEAWPAHNLTLSLALLPQVSDDDLDPSFTVSTSKGWSQGLGPGGTGGKWGEHEPQLSMSAILPHSLGPPRRLQWEL